MALGENLEVALAVKDLDATMTFFEKLGFLKFGDIYEKPHRWVILSDGDIYIGLHEYEEPSPYLMYFTNQFPEKVAFVERLGIPMVSKMKMDDKLIMIAFEDPHGQRIGIADLMGAEIETPKIAQGASIGKFGEFSIPTDNLDEAVAYWKQLGFDGEIYTEPYPWAILGDGLITIGLHQTNDFTDITLTYFSEQMTDKIQDVKNQGIELLSEEKTEAGETVAARINSPDGQLIFLVTGKA